MATGLLGTAISGLQAFQLGLATVGHNIANVNTEGYSRQRVDLVARNAEGTGAGFVGQGVEAASIKRFYDRFVTQRVREAQAGYQELEAYRDVAARLDDLLADPEVGLSTAVQRFFDAVQDVAADPTSTPARQLLLSEAETLADRFQFFSDQIDALQAEVRNRLQGAVSEVNALAASIAELNTRIAAAQGQFNQPPNDLLDQRDALLQRLSEYVAVQVQENEDGSASVFIGNGQSLVLGGSAASLTLVRSDFDPQRWEVALQAGPQTINVNEQISGGEMGGLLAVRRQVLDTAQNGIGRVALALAGSVNTQHQLGEDLAGNPGGLFFADVLASAPRALANANNDPASGSITVAIADYAELGDSDYQLSYDGSTFTLLRLSDNTVVDSGFTPGDLPRTIAGEGIALALTGTVAAGDRFLIQPTRAAAGDMAVVLDAPTAVAAAAPGTGVGDNSNALALADLRNQGILSGGSATFQEAYGETLGKVAVRTRQAQINAEALKGVYDQAVATRNGIAGVNLDEEAAKLIQYQQAYQAAARMISVTETLFQSLMAAVGG